MSEIKIFSSFNMEYTKLFVVILSLFQLINCDRDLEPIVLVHGGAENLNADQIEARINGVKQAAADGYRVLKRGGSVIDAVEEAVKTMEKDEAINAGVGSCLNLDGEVEMDASIMVGSNLSSGGVTGIKNVLHPVSLARLVMESSPHFVLAGDGLKRFAKDHHVPLISMKNLITRKAKDDLREILRNKTTDLSLMGGGGAGAVAIDSSGRLAAATSTGGTFGRMPGRVSDASMIGASIYADDEVGATAVTGHGESIARYALAHEIMSTMKRGFDATTATRNTIKGIYQRFHKPVGAITLSTTGQVGISFTSDKMAWAYQIRDDIHYGIDDYHQFSAKIDSLRKID